MKTRSRRRLGSATAAVLFGLLATAAAPSPLLAAKASYLYYTSSGNLHAVRLDGRNLIGEHRVIGRGGWTGEIAVDNGHLYHIAQDNLYGYQVNGFSLGRFAEINTRGWAGDLAVWNGWLYRIGPEYHGPGSYSREWHLWANPISGLQQTGPGKMVNANGFNGSVAVSNGWMYRMGPEFHGPGNLSRQSHLWAGRVDDSRQVSPVKMVNANGWVGDLAVSEGWLYRTGPEIQPDGSLSRDWHLWAGRIDGDRIVEPVRIVNARFWTGKIAVGVFEEREADGDLCGSLPPAVCEALADFERSSLSGVWPNLRKASLLREIRDRVINPYVIDQGRQSFCGTAAVMFDLARKKPVTYVRVCQALFEYGGFRIRDITVSARSGLRQSSVPAGMAQVDWMTLATLRDSENLLFPVDTNPLTQIAGITFPWELRGWSRSLLGLSNTGFEFTLGYSVEGNLNVLRNAAAVAARGGTAFLLMDQDLLSSRDPFWTVPNHWVVLDSAVRHENGRVIFDVSTWGDKRRINASESRFKKLFWGAVTALP